MDKKQARLRRARKTRARIAELKMARLSVHRTNCHIYAQIIDETGSRVLAQASTLEAEVKKELANAGNAGAAALIGKRIAEKAIEKGISAVVFDKGGYKYHGRVKELADGARLTPTVIRLNTFDSTLARKFKRL